MDNIKVGDFVRCAGEGIDVFKVVKVEKKRAALHTGWWEPLHKLCVLPADKVTEHTRIEYIYDGDDDNDDDN